MMAVKLKLVDSQGTLWVIPGEVLMTKFSKRHRFILHKSISLENDEWVVTHERTSASVGSGRTKQLAIDAAVAALKPLRVAEFEALVEAAVGRRPPLLVGELVRTYAA